jgi:phospholipid/cholesterol/gamma-HCH transport system substrate-binding protein
MTKMKATPTQKIRIGLFTLAGMAVLLVGIFLIGARKNMFGNKYIIYGTFKNVSGLQPGNMVRFNGINIGTIQAINISTDSTVTVAMSLQTNVQRYIKIDAVAGIGSDGLMGDKLITITPGNHGTEPILDGGFIATTVPMDFDKTLAKFNRVVDNATSITTAIADISGRISSGQGSLGRLVYHDDLERGLERTVEAAHNTVTTATRTVAAVHETIVSAHETIDSAKATLKTAQVGITGFTDNMEAAKHTFLLRGYFKRKAREASRKQRQDSLRLAGVEEQPATKEDRKTRRLFRKAEHNTESTPITGLAP